MNDYQVVIDCAKIPLSLYIHIPWCVKKCPYCDFNSHQANSLSIHSFESYVQALIADLQSQLELVQDRPISSIFIGGGTPSLLPTWAYHQLFSAVRNCLVVDKTVEITLEANPGTLEHAPFAEYLQLGINRLSLGVQSFDERALTALGRIHTQREAIKAIEQARLAGFERVNVDLMHGLPNQTSVLAVSDIERALGAGATHISWYQLTVEPNTAFYRAPPDLPDETTLEQIETLGKAVLHKAGFTNYEVSAWVGPSDAPCRHNMNYWQFGDYLAIGAGAHGKITDRHGVYRFYKTRLPKDYVNYDTHPKMVEFEPILPKNLPFEFMMNALRLSQGVETGLFEQRTGLSIQTIESKLQLLQRQGLMVTTPNRLASTELGFRYVNHLISQFL